MNEKKTEDTQIDKVNHTSPETEEIERFVMPFTNWIEGKLHSSSFVNPTKKHINKNSDKTKATGLRQAIRKALKSLPGTVLSAEKSNKGGIIEYRIKIISKAGVVKIVTIPETDQPNVKER